MENILFTSEAGRPTNWNIFLETPLGRIYQTIPFQGLVDLLPAKKTNSGAKPRFDYQGGIGLQVLKHYYKVSDEKLIELLNTNWVMQYFCGISLKQGDWIRDTGIVSRWRIFLGKHLDEQLAQKVMAQEWETSLSQKQSGLTDATCFESYIRFPTDVKLLWESIEYLRTQLVSISQAVKLPMFRSRYREIKKVVHNYRKKRKKTHKETKRLKLRLINLLDRFLTHTPQYIAAWKKSDILQLVGKQPFRPDFFKKIHTIKKVQEQQYFLYHSEGNSVPNRIVSLAKPYLRPIVRGKENKRVEFGLKANILQIDGINFVEYPSFEAFHEGVRLKQTIWLHRHLVGKCSHMGADAIYATNANRKFCTQEGIITSFIPKGRRAKDDEQKQILRKAIAKERSTRLEGSFGTVKNHYLLDKIKARIEPTERAWIFWGIFTANAVAMTKKRKPPLAA